MRTRSAKDEHSSRSPVALVTRIVTRRRLHLLNEPPDPIVGRRALPLNLSDQRPLEAALARNIQAALSHRAGCPLADDLPFRAQGV